MKTSSSGILINQIQSLRNILKFTDAGRNLCLVFIRKGAFVISIEILQYCDRFCFADVLDFFIGDHIAENERIKVNIANSNRMQIAAGDIRIFILNPNLDGTGISLRRMCRKHNSQQQAKHQNKSHELFHRISSFLGFLRLGTITPISRNSSTGAARNGATIIG